MDQRNVLIVENREFDYNFEGKNDKGEYVLEGVFGEVDKKNRNNRIYSESEYVPKVEKLQESAKRGKLVGELDHPNSLEVQYKNASHIIDKIWYDDQNKQVKGKLRLINTSAGRDAMGMVDAGVQLSISSRASGSVDESGHVKLNNLVTYDLVSDPGFENAELKCMNEELGLNESTGMYVFELDSEGGNNTKGINSPENKGPEMSSYVTKEEFQQYSETVKKWFEDLQNKLSTLEESSPSSSEGDEGSNSDRIAKLENWASVICKGGNKLQEDTKALDSEKETLKEYTNYLRNGLENVKDYAEHNNGVMEDLKNYAEHNNGLVERVKDYAEKVNEDLKVVKEYAEHVKDSAKLRAEYQDKINTEVLDNLVEYAEKNNNNIKDLVEYAEEAMAKVESLEGSAPSKASGSGGNSGGSASGGDEYMESIDQKLETIAESAKQQKAEGEDEEGFLNFVSKENRDHYKTLDRETKDSIVEAFRNASYSNVVEADSIYEGAIKEASSLDWYEDAPQYYKDLFENLSNEQKRKLRMQAGIAEFNSQEDVKNWWETRNIGKKDPQIIDERNGSKSGDSSLEDDPILGNQSLQETLGGIG